MRVSMLFVLVAIAVGCLGCGGGNGGPGEANPFAGHYAGSYHGSESGTITATVAATGRLTGEAISPSCGTMPVSGAVAAAGDVSASARCGAWTITYSGLFTQAGSVRSASGTWQSSSGYSGTWQVQEMP